MSLVKRGAVWHVNIRRPDGSRDRHSTGTSDKQKAREYHDRLVAQYWEQARFGAKPERRWEEGVKRYLDECRVDGLAESTVRNYEQQLKWWGDEYFAGKNLSEVSKGKIMEGVYRIAKDRSQSTANRYLAPIRSMLYRAAGDWEWLDKAPAKFKQFDESGNARTRALSPDEIKAVADELPPHQREMFLFSVATGLRQANVKKLQWTWIDLQQRLLRVPKQEFKNRTELVIPLNESAIRILRSRLGKHSTFVFTYLGSPVENVNTRAWRKALQRAGVEDYRNHDNRHTWAHTLRREGVALEDIQDLGGWKDPKMVRRYATPDMNALAQRASRIDGVLTQTEHRPDLRVVGGSASP
jgi:integrase